MYTLTYTLTASMRPRHFAGESHAAGSDIGCQTASFNEAPAFRRGKSPAVPPPHTHVTALQ